MTDDPGRGVPPLVRSPATKRQQVDQSGDARSLVTQTSLPVEFSDYR